MIPWASRTVRQPKPQKAKGSAGLLQRSLSLAIHSMRVLRRRGRLLRRNVQRVDHRVFDEAGGVRLAAGAVAALHSGSLDVLGVAVGEHDVGAVVRMPRRTWVVSAPAIRVLDPGQTEVGCLTLDLD